MNRTVPGSWRLFAPALLGWAYAAWLIGVPEAAETVAVVVTAAVLVLVGLCVWPRTRQHAVTMLQVCVVTAVVIITVSARVDALMSARASPDLMRAGSIEMSVRLEGYPQSVEGPGGSRYWVRAEVHADRGAVPVTMWGDGLAPDTWAPGQPLTVLGTTRTLPTTDGSAYAVTLLEVHAYDVSPYRRLISELRNQLVDVAREIPGGSLVPGFAVGDSRLVDDHLEHAMRESSLTHLIAVSGANCALIVTAVLWGVSWFRVKRRLRLVIAAGVLGGFVVIVGPDPSIQRAALMALVTLASRFGGKRATAFASLGVAMLVLLGADPWQARHPGFTLSVAATAGILVMTTPLHRWFQYRLRMPSWLSLPFAVTLSAQVACGPLLLFLQPGLPVGGVAANVLAAPAAPFGTGLGLLAMVLTEVHAEAAVWVARLAALAGTWIEWLAFTTADSRHARVAWPGGGAGALLLLCTQGAIAAAIWLRRTQPRSPWERATRGRTGRRYVVWALSGLGVGILVGLTAVTPVVQRIGTPQQWFLVMCDVGQGDAILIRDPKQPHRVMLTDTGDDPEKLRQCLDRFGVNGISLLVLTHDDHDHVGAVSEIIGESAEAIISPPPTGFSETRTVSDVLTRTNTPFVQGLSGMTGTLGAGSAVQWEILAPAPGDVIASTNAASVVMQVEVAGVRTLMLGDTGRIEHEQLIRRSPHGLRSDIIKVAHHGSRDHDPQLFVDSAARIGLISAGLENRHGHPSDDVLVSLATAGAASYRTDHQGSIAVSMIDGELRVWTER